MFKGATMHQVGAFFVPVYITAAFSPVLLS